MNKELCGPGERKLVCLESEKSLKFHLMDTEITSSELWATWHKNEGISLEVGVGGKLTESKIGAFVCNKD